MQESREMELHGGSVESGCRRKALGTRMEELPELMTVEQFQQLAQISRTKAYELVRTGKLPVIRLGKSIRIRKSLFLEMLSCEQAA